MDKPKVERRGVFAFEINQVEIARGCGVPWAYGFSYYKPTQCVAVFYPIPLNLLVRTAYRFWMRCRCVDLTAVEEAFMKKFYELYADVHNVAYHAGEREAGAKFAGELARLSLDVRRLELFAKTTEDTLCEHDSEFARICRKMWPLGTAEKPGDHAQEDTAANLQVLMIVAAGRLAKAVRLYLDMKVTIVCQEERGYYDNMKSRLETLEEIAARETCH